METPPSANKPKSAVVKNECVQVVVRCRPMSKKELAGGDYKPVVDVYPLRGVIEIQNPAEANRDSAKMFTYDAVYDKNSTQQDIYDEIVRPLVTSVLEGFNCCVFAYGQTGTGKTHTMEGVRSDADLQGIIPRAFEQIWSHINRAENQTFLVTASYMEIYMEELRDLLRPQARPLELREREHCGVFVPNLHAVDCKSVDEMLAVMAQGNKNRTTGKTNMNEHSSRSHAIFSIKIEMCDESTNKVNVGKLHLIDLAGSERQSKTGATAERLREASKINRALSSLGNVISALAENSPHIPYRDSKLTRLLQDSLGGNSKTIMIANVGPSGYNYNETLTTLRYAHRAKTIQNKPVKNVDPQDAKLKEYQEEIARLRLLITERQNREKTLPRRKREKVKKPRNKAPLVAPTSTTPVTTNGVKMVDEIARTDAEDIDGDGDDDDDDDDEEYDDDEDDNSTGDREPDNNVLAYAEVDAETKEAVQREKEISQQLANKLKELESQVVQGGRNILETYSERQIELEKRLNEIAERKKREVEMQQQLEATEESTIRPMRDTLTSVQEEVEQKTRKLKKCYAKYMALKQELVDTRDDHNRDRRELEMTQNELIKELKRLLLIIDNFVPVEVKVRLYTQSRYDEEQEEWSIHPSHMTESTVSAGGAHTRRPVSVAARRRPVSEYALKQIKTADSCAAARIPTDGQLQSPTTTAASDAGFASAVRFKGENIVSYDLDYPMRTTHEYQNPKVSASLQAVLAEAMQTNDVLDINGQSSYPANMRSRLDKIMKRDSVSGSGLGAMTSNGSGIMMGSSRSKSSIPEVTRRSSSATPKKPTSAYPKARGLVTNK